MAIPWNKGKKTGLVPKTAFKKGVPSWNKGKKGIMKPNKTSFKKGFKPWNTGKPWDEETKEKMSAIRKNNPKVSGKNHWNWKEGITPLHEKIRKSMDYKIWREAVFARDKWTCVWCLKEGGDLEVDHIKPFSLYPELRFAIDNGITLSTKAHKEFHQIYGKYRNTPEQLSKFLLNGDEL